MSELHNRLAHLVNYSSQLIFVSGDSISDQQKTLNAFLESQQENTEISFFAASPTKQVIDYRSAICRQLGGHLVGSFVRPLPVLLNDPVSGLDAQNGPYLVCITQAEYLSEAFLQELWDWVMHSQQREHKLHLNIILFGKASWAKHSQQWLPMQNSHKPVLLSSASVDPVGFDVNALEALMADKHSWFSTSNKPIVANKWFIGSVLSIFFVIFIGLMAWQYPKQIESLLVGKAMTTETLSSDLLDNGLKSETTPIADTNELIDDNQLVTIKSASEPFYSTPLEVVSPTSIIPQNNDDKNNNLTDTLLVSSWPNTVKRIDDYADNVQTETSLTENAKIINPDADNTSENDIPNPTIQEVIKQSDIKKAVNSGDDFQVPDIISVAQLDEQFSQNQENTIDSNNLGEFLNAKYTVERKIVENTVSESENLPSEQQISAQTVSAIDYKFDETTLLSLPTDSIVLQLSGIQNPVVLENYLNNNDLKASTWVYETQRYGGPWFVVVYKQSFDSIDAALNLLSSLPADIREAQPFAKSINQIQQEISRR